MTEMTPTMQLFTAGNVAEAAADLLVEHSPARMRGWCLDAIDLNELGAAQNRHDPELVELYEEHLAQHRIADQHRHDVRGAEMCRVVADRI